MENKFNVSGQMRCNPLTGVVHVLKYYYQRSHDLLWDHFRLSFIVLFLFSLLEQISKWTTHIIKCVWIMNNTLLYPFPFMSDIKSRGWHFMLIFYNIRTNTQYSILMHVGSWNILKCIRGKIVKTFTDWFQQNTSFKDMYSEMSAKCRTFAQAPICN